MSIPNTTPTPNELFNGQMKLMSDTELRLVLIVTRATLGWQVDKATGRRKAEDWISYYQLKQKTGRCYTSLANAIDHCIKRKWIEARSKGGDILDTKSKRIGSKIYYRLGKIFIDKITTSSLSEEVAPTTSSHSEEVAPTTSSHSEEVAPKQEILSKKEDTTLSSSSKKEPTSSECVITDCVITQCEAYKRNPIQKKPYTKDKKGLTSKPTKKIKVIRRSKSFKREDYEKVLKEYQELKGLTLQGNEFAPIQQAIKTMFLSDRTPDQIISCMQWFTERASSGDRGFEWCNNWTMNTIKIKLPEFLGNQFESFTEVKIPEYAKEWQTKK